jgi:hypothetical protein
VHEDSVTFHGIHAEGREEMALAGVAAFLEALGERE